MDNGFDYSCNCAAGFIGTNCETNIDDCPTPNPCQNGGICVDGINTYTCTCVPGYAGSDCETNVDDCPTANPCQNGGTCKDGINSYTCQCTPGFIGSECSNIDDCVTNPCQNGGTCQDGINSYTCHCPENYDGNLCDLGTKQILHPLPRFKAYNIFLCLTQKTINIVKRSHGGAC